MTRLKIIFIRGSPCIALLVFSAFFSLVSAQTGMPPQTVGEAEQILIDLRRDIADLKAAEAKIQKRESNIIVTDPTAKDFAKLPSVVRLRVRDAAGVNFGTGSVILSEKGRALIITVSHIFRNANAKSVIEVDIFNPKTGKVETFTTGYKGIIKTDSTSDVGLLVIPSTRVLPVLPIASSDSPLKVGERVKSYGCGGGEPPSSLLHRITAFNRYVGPDTIECTGVPQQGRSGGALVNGEGELIGITIAADNRDQRGLYAGLAPINAILESVGIDPKTLQK